MSEEKKDTQVTAGDSEEMQSSEDVVVQDEVSGESVADDCEVSSESVAEDCPCPDAPPVGQGHRPPPPPGHGSHHHLHHHGEHPHSCSCGHPHPGAQTPLMELSFGKKFGWAVLGFCLGWVAILIAWLVNVDSAPKVRSASLKFSAIGFIVLLVITAIVVGMICASIASMVASLNSAVPYTIY